MLLVVGGLLVASFVNVLRVDRGFTTTSVVAADIELPAARYPDAPSRARFFDALLEALGREPGVGVAGLSRALPLEGLATVDGFVPVGDAARSLDADRRQSRSGERRIFRRDRAAAAAWTPVDASRSRASGRRHQRPHRQDALARTGRARPELQARSRRHFRGHRRCGRREDPGLRARPRPRRLRPLRSQYAKRALARDPGERWRQRRHRECAARGQGARSETCHLRRVRTLDSVVDDALAMRRFQVRLLAAFGAAGLLLACLGIYGVLSAMVEGRRGELAIRLALGAPPSRVGRLIVRQGLIPVIAGLAIGLTAGSGRRAARRVAVVRRHACPPRGSRLGDRNRPHRGNRRVPGTRRPRRAHIASCRRSR